MMQAIKPPLPLPESPREDGLIDLLQLLRAILRYKWGILGLGFAIALATGLYVSTLTPTYRATASIVLELQDANVVSVEELYSLGRNSYDYFSTQFEILKSRNLAERVVRRLGLHQQSSSGASPPTAEAARPWYQPDLTALLPAREKEPPPQLSEQEQEELRVRSLASGIAGGLTVSPVEYSHIAYLSYVSGDPREAATIVNAIAEEFISSNLDARLEGTVQATAWLSERLTTLETNLRDSEQALQAFRDLEGLVNVEGVTGVGGHELRLLSQRLEEARRARIEAENILEEVRGLKDAGVEDLMTLPAVLEHQLIRELSHEQSLAERRVAELGKRYGPRHPRMIAALSDLEVARDELGGEVRKVVSGISREYELALRNEQQLLETWEARKSEIQEFNRKEFRLQELQRDVDTNRELYDIFLTRIKGVSETGGFERPHARIVDRAMVPAVPFKPDRQRAVIIAFVLGLLLGCGIAILLDILDNTVKSPDDVSSRLDAVLLGALPRMDQDSEGSFPQFWQAPTSEFAESIRTVRTGLLLSSLDKPAQVVLVTSTQPGEGKSVTVLNLGSALGQMEKTLVIGADLRRPSLARKCNLAAEHRGLSHFVSGSADLDECIEYLEELSIHVMPAGIIPPNPLEMISSMKFAEALESLRQQFDRIIIDSAPARAVSDALVLASLADAVIYVVKADATSATQARNGLESIAGANGQLTGVVLNQLTRKRSDGYRYGDGYYGYGHYSERGANS